MKPRSPTLQADSSPAEPSGKPKNAGVGSHPFSRGSSQSRDRNQVSRTAGGFLTSRASREALPAVDWHIYSLPTLIGLRGSYLRLGASRCKIGASLLQHRSSPHTYQKLFTWALMVAVLHMTDRLCSTQWQWLIYYIWPNPFSYGSISNLMDFIAL